MTRGGKMVYLGSFATAEEAALCIARLPERNVAAERAAAVERAAAALPLSEENQANPDNPPPRSQTYRRPWAPIACSALRCWLSA